MTLHRGVWSMDEHDRFLEAIEFHPDGPWNVIAAMVGTRNPRQVQTHAQKYYDKIARRLRGLQRDRNALNGREHRIEACIIKLVSKNSPELDAVRARVSAVCKRPRGRKGKAEYASKSTDEYTTPPPCLQRLRVLPRSAGQRYHTNRSLRYEEAPTVSGPHWSHLEPVGETEGDDGFESLLLPPFDQALDFLIANLDDDTQEAAPLLLPSRHPEGFARSHAVCGFNAHDAKQH